MFLGLLFLAAFTLGASVLVSGPTVPGPPSLYSVDPADRQVTLSWSAPLIDGGSPITNYSVYRGTTLHGETLLVKLGSVLAYVDANVTKDQSYYYVVTATNAVGEGPRSGEWSVIAHTRPTCAVAAPLPHAVVLGVYAITGSAFSLNGTVQRVEVRIDNGSWLSAIGTLSWTYDWDTSQVSDGPHTIHARSFDGVVYSAEASVSVVVDNPPPPSWSLPLWVILGLAVVLVVCVAVLLSVVLRRRKRRGKRIPGDRASEPDH